MVGSFPTHPAGRQLQRAPEQIRLCRRRPAAVGPGVPAGLESLLSTRRASPTTAAVGQQDCLVVVARECPAGYLERHTCTRCDAVMVLLARPEGRSGSCRSVEDECGMLPRGFASRAASLLSRRPLTARPEGHSKSATSTSGTGSIASTSTRAVCPDRGTTCSCCDSTRWFSFVCVRDVVDQPSVATGQQGSVSKHGMPHGRGSAGRRRPRGTAAARPGALSNGQLSLSIGRIG